MIFFEDALKTVLSQEFSLGRERVAISDSPGRILAEDIFSDLDMPPFDKSAVDGYACRMGAGSENTGRPFLPRPAGPLRMVETIAAGSVPQRTILAGECSKIMTGAMVPPGADCVVMVEDTEPARENLVRIIRQNGSKNICFRGEDVHAGDRVLQRGQRINPALSAVLASVGAVNPLVAKLPRVGIISTGNELVEPGVFPSVGRIRNSNALQLEAQARTVPAQPAYYGIVPDEGPALRKTIDLALAGNDVVLLTGGVSMGDFDFVPSVMQEAGIEILFDKIAIQPGKPTVFGRRKNTFIFGLPGNPVSSFVLFEMLVRPFLQHMMGFYSEPMALKLPMGVDYSRRRSVRKSMVPVIIREGAVFPVEYHGSAHMNAYTAASGIMAVEIGVTDIKKGELADVRLL